MNKYKVLNVIKKSKSICIIGHIDPDADALASMIVLKDFLKDKFKISYIDLFADCAQISEIYNELIENAPINSTPSNYDVAIILDSPNLERIGIYKSLFESAKKTIVIDHHATNEFFGDFNLVENCSSTCEIIYQILRSYKYKISQKNQGKIYAGIITDTNNFTVGNFNKRTLQFVSRCIDNINKHEIYNHFLRKNSLKQTKLLSLAINNIKSFHNDSIIISHISTDDSEKCQASTEDFTGIVNYLATISNSKLVCFIYPKDNCFYVSMRASHNYDVSQIAKKNGGGGHKGAAAYLSNNDLSKIENDILLEFEKLLKETFIKNIKLF